MTVSCIIVDDEQYARKLLSEYASRLPFLEVKAECRNSMEAMKVLQEQDVDLIFLDIQMPELTGIDFLKSLSSKPVVIFTTAYQEYAIEGYQLDVVDYMLKPISFERFVKGVNKAMDLIRLRRAGNKDKQMISSGTAGDAEDAGFINLKADYKVYRVKIDDILYIEGLREYVTFYTAERKYVALQSLKKLEEMLPSSKFIRVHKSYIVNRDRVRSLYGNMIEIGETEVPIGKNYAGRVKRVLFSH